MGKSGSATGIGRCLPCNAMGALNQLCSSQASWWPDLLSNWAPSGSSGHLRLAIRDRYMNFYAKGQSVARINFGRGGASPTMSIHQKYVCSSTDGGQRYIKLSGEEGRDADGRPVTWGGPEMLTKWISKSHCYTSTEKCRIESLVEQSPKVIDLEMGLPAFGERKSPLRIDLVSLEGTSDDIRLVFWEAKMIRDSRLRSRTRQPRVFEQMDAYRSYLAEATRKQQVADAYRNCCRIVRDLHEMASGLGMSHPIDPLIVAAAETDSLHVEETPRLIIFDDGGKRDETAWQEHLEVLCREEIVTIVDENSVGLPLESIPRRGG